MGMTIEAINDLRQRVLQVRRGELPPDSVTDEELQEAINELRHGRVTSAAANTAKAEKKAAASGMTIDLSDIKFD